MWEALSSMLTTTATQTWLLYRVATRLSLVRDILSPRLYINDGKGNFTRSYKGWPAISVNASCVRAADFDGDGKPDIFIGARNVPGSYGVSPSSFLLKNNGDGTFTDITQQSAPALVGLGMVTDAQWADIDGDGKKELIVVGDWMPVTIFKNNNGRLQLANTIAHSSGWWNCVTIADINGDGFPDLVAGNFGLNSRIKADQQHPAKMYVDDFDNNGQTECVPVYYKSDGKAYPYYLKGEMEMQIPILKKKFLKFESYAGKGIEDVFTKEQLDHAKQLTVEETQTCIFINDGRAILVMQPLPVMAQLSPVFGIISTDLNGDGLNDLFLAGNFFGMKPQAGRFDASYGTTLLADASHQFKWLPPAESGLFIKGEARDIVMIPSGKKNATIIVSMNNDKLYAFRKNSK